MLRAAGREGEARYIANVAYTTNTITCSIYAFFLAGLAVWKMQAESHGIWTRDWVWGLLIVAGLALLKRQESFIVAILRAHQEYSLTARADVLESVLMAIGMFIGIRLNGLNGVLQSIGLVLFAKILFLRSSNPLRFQWAWDLSATWKLMRTGLPILANAIVFGAIIGLDRGVILVFFAEGERSVGLYSVAVLGTSWCMDLAGRVVLVLYTHFQTTYGISSSPRQVAEQAVQASEFQASLLAPLSGAAYIVGPVLLGRSSGISALDAWNSCPECRFSRASDDDRGWQNDKPSQGDFARAGFYRSCGDNRREVGWTCWYLKWHDCWGACRLASGGSCSIPTASGLFGLSETSTQTCSFYRLAGCRYSVHIVVFPTANVRAF